ncbi:NADH-dependent FMN reductase SfnF [Paraburkholderia domus]|uniref:NAD(P)H-dependent oxidoreductase n=1 Tax=Paraburkholderia domus TaxID=2793075 RepID=UPI001912073F|nr:NAD(P)H-dependent oxidoreductase [Paraburkholderia domus]MBK5050475.1 NAD(P)H-dependent oxidoreductase [Burkholderia sp. R-70006]CAE6754288.1 NADH-dependent FMN reductase SfnF [Paraburkholderia domus]
MKVVVVVGNPKPASRTVRAANLLAESLGGTPADIVVDIVDLGAGILGWGDPGTKAAVEAVADANVVVFGSPTFKASYTGLLKLFLDQFATGDGLLGTVAIPLMLGAGPAHAMAPDLLLKPVLVELGATCPTPGLYLLDNAFEDGVAIEKFSSRWRPVIAGCVSTWSKT